MDRRRRAARQTAETLPAPAGYGLPAITDGEAWRALRAADRAEAEARVLRALGLVADARRR